MKAPIKTIFLLSLSVSLLANDGIKPNDLESLRIDQKKSLEEKPTEAVVFNFKDDFKESFVYMVTQRR